MCEGKDHEAMTQEELIAKFVEEYGWSGTVMEGELRLEDVDESLRLRAMSLYPQQYQGVDKEASASWQDWVLDPSKERGVLGLLLDVAECAVIGGVGVVNWVRGMVVNTYMGRSERNGRAE